jgi:hypothetical protein
MRNLLYIGLAIGLSATRCKEDENPVDDHVHVDGNTIVSASFHWLWDTTPFNTSGTYTTLGGEPMKFTRARFFLAQPYFKDDGGNEVASFPGRYILVDVNEGALVRTIGELDAHLHTMHFILGLDSVTNHNDLFENNDPPLDDGSMHWGWNPVQGYLFMQLEGKFDSDDNGVVDASDMDFTYHCATDGLRRDAVLDVHTDALNGGNLILDMEVDMRRVIGNLDVEAENDAQGPNFVTTGLMDRLVTAISLP